jgi:hypothetical protein
MVVLGAAYDRPSRGSRSAWYCTRGLHRRKSSTPAARAPVTCAEADAGALGLVLEGLQGAGDDRVGVPDRIADAELARHPQRRVHHRGDVVDVPGDVGDALADGVGTAGGHAEQRRPLVDALGPEDLMASGKEADDRSPDGEVGARHAREHHVVDRLVVLVLGAADVVPQDLVDAQVGSFGGDVEVVLLDGARGEVGEAAVGAVRRPIRLLDDPVAVTVLPGGLGQDRVAVDDDATDDPDPPPVQLVHRLAQPVVVPDRADLLGERHLRVVADVAVLVLEVELDGVDPARVDEVEDVALQARRAPGDRRHVHAVDRRTPDGDEHLLLDDVVGLVPGDEQHGAGRRARVAEGEAAVVVELDRVAVRRQQGVGIDPTVDADGRSHASGGEAARRSQRRGRGVDQQLPREAGRGQDGSGHGQHQLVLANHEGTRRSPPEAAVDPLRLVEGPTVEGEAGGVERLGGVDGDAQVDLAGLVERQGVVALQARAGEADAGGGPQAPQQEEAHGGHAEHEEEVDPSQPWPRPSVEQTAAPAPAGRSAERLSGVEEDRAASVGARTGPAPPPPASRGGAGDVSQRGGHGEGSGSGAGASQGAPPDLGRLRTVLAVGQ